jgi:transmembrane sensor
MNLNNLKNIEVLIHEYLKGTISEQEKDELFRWIVQDAANVTYFNQIADVWLSSSVFQETQGFEPDEALKRVQRRIHQIGALVPQAKQKKRLVYWYKSAAAILLPFIIIGTLTLLPLGNKNKSAALYTFEVPYGSKSTIVLPDGSKVVLNSGSKLTCNEGFGKTHRHLNLIGEGYFSVSKNKELPFIVHAGNLDVKALGTEFNVKAYPEDNIVETILVEGTIQVTKKQLENANEKPVTLFPKQSLVYNKKSDSIEVNIAIEKNTIADQNPLPISPMPKVAFSHTDVNPVIYTTWKEAAWNIYRKELGELAIELERKYDVKIHFGSEALKKIKFTGTLRNESLEQVLAALRLASPVEYKVKGKLVELNENKALMPEYNQFYNNK